MFRFLALLLLIAAGPALAGPLPATVAGALNDARLPATAVAIVVRPLDGATPLVEHNPDAPMNPASVMKLLTTYAALDLLGPAHTWATDAWIDAPAVDGVVDGNMYLQGSGSPRFVAEDLWNLLRRLRVRGIRHIAGDVVLDRGVFDVPRIDPGAFDAKPMRPYNVGPDGLLIDFQTLRFTLQPDLGRTRVLLETPNAVLVIDNRLRSSDEPCRSDWKDRIRTQLAGDGRTLEFSGHYPAACGEKTLNLAPLSADAQADGLIRALWRELGGTLAGRVRSGSVPAGAQRVARQESPPLADVVRDINKFSNNVMARQLFLTLGNDTAPATAERARARLAGWLAGCPPPRLPGAGRRQRFRPVAQRADQRRQPRPPAGRRLAQPGDARIHVQPAGGRRRRHDEEAPERLAGQRPCPHQERLAGRRAQRRRLRARCAGPALRRRLPDQPSAGRGRRRGDRRAARLGRPRGPR
jgi:D-alanyl-D-alanine carboxypeptidase/D-alanyl-D-alanine-endopeptidase (penicillin-binding protein 4)